MDVPEHGGASRVSAHTAVAAKLSAFSDHELAKAVAAAPSLGTGIGGRSAETEVDGVRVFVKRVPLTDLELRPGNIRSTRNVFRLPLFYQYGIGSAGFGAWRELAAHLVTTAWVLGDEYPGFPLLHHWRVLPDAPPENFADGLGGIEGAVAHWEGSPAVRHRLEAIAAASHSLVLFLEHIPHTLARWLGTARHEAPESPYLWAEEELGRGTEFMSAHGLVHFDAHFANVLTDGRQVYFADLGLALSRTFDLSADERDFHTAHLDYDRSYAPTHLLRHHLPKAVRADSDLRAFLHRWLAGHRPADVPPDIAAVIDRHAPHAAVLDDFHHRLLMAERQADDLVNGLSQLKGRDAVVAVLGNHDYWSDPWVVRQVLTASGVNELANIAHTVRRGNATLHIAGVDDIWEGHDRLDRVIHALPADGAVVLLAHEPDFADESAASGRIDLQLSGHSHGGQIVAPFAGPLHLPYLGRKYPSGRYQIGGMIQYTNRGVGMISPFVRLNCRPEITIFHLHAQNNCACGHAIAGSHSSVIAR